MSPSQSVHCFNPPASCESHADVSGKVTIFFWSIPKITREHLIRVIKKGPALQYCIRMDKMVSAGS